MVRLVIYSNESMSRNQFLDSYLPDEEEDDDDEEDEVAELVGEPLDDDDGKGDEGS